MDKSLIIKEIKKLYNIKSDADFARYIGISSQNVYTWIKRNTYDATIILAKCPELNAEWLLTGKGEMLKNEEQKNQINIPNYSSSESVTMPREVFDLIVSQQKTIESQQKDAEKLTNSFLSQQKTIESQQRTIENHSKKTIMEDAKGVVKMEILG